MAEIFKKLILLGRPAQRKSEIIDIKKNLHPKTAKTLPYRKNRGNDDFPMLWTWFEEDAILEKKMGKPRMHSDPRDTFYLKYQMGIY